METDDRHVFHSTTEEELNLIDPSVAALVRQLRSSEYGYIDVRVLSDGSIAALQDFMYTRGILFDCERDGYGCRFCYPNRELASYEYWRLVNSDTAPRGYLKVKPEWLEARFSNVTP